MIDQMTFAHLKESDLARLSAGMSDNFFRHQVIDSLIAYLNLWLDKEWIDEEKLFYLGRDLAKVCDISMRNLISEKVSLFAPPNASMIFLAGFDTTEKPATAPSKPPASSVLDRNLKSAIDVSSPEARESLADIMASYLRYAEHSGDAEPLARSTGKVASALLKVRNENRNWAGHFGQSAIRNALIWAPTNDILWTLWGRSFAQTGDLEAAELIYWETIHQFPWNAYVRSHLIEVLIAQRREQAALSLAEASSLIFPSNKTIIVQFANLLRKSDRKNRFQLVSDLLMESMQLGDRNFYEETVLAAAIAQSEQEETSEETILHNIYVALNRRPEVLAGVIRALIRHQKSTSAAQKVFNARGGNYASDEMIENLIKNLAANLESAPTQDETSSRKPDSELSEAVHDFTSGSLVENPNSDTLALLPEDVVNLGSVRKLRFELETGPADLQTKQLIASLAAARSGEPAGLYARLIAFRHEMIEPEVSEMTSFAFAFEQALKDEDQKKLDLLAKRFPRLVALTIVAKALFGDNKSALKIENIIRADDSSLHPAALLLRRRLKNHLELIEGGLTAEEVFNKNRTDIRNSLYDANEAALHTIPRVA